MQADTMSCILSEFRTECRTQEAIRNHKINSKESLLFLLSGENRGSNLVRNQMSRNGVIIPANNCNTGNPKNGSGHRQKVENKEAVQSNTHTKPKSKIKSQTQQVKIKQKGKSELADCR